jgi:hypothetical protein
MRDIYAVCEACQRCPPEPEARQRPRCSMERHSAAGQILAADGRGATRTIRTVLRCRTLIVAWLEGSRIACNRSHQGTGE